MWFWIEQNILFPGVIVFSVASVLLLIARAFGAFKKWSMWACAIPFLVTVIFWIAMFSHCVNMFAGAIGNLISR